MFERHPANYLRHHPSKSRNLIIYLEKIENCLAYFDGLGSMGMSTPLNSHAADRRVRYRCSDDRDGLAHVRWPVFILRLTHRPCYVRPNISATTPAPILLPSPSHAPVAIALVCNPAKTAPVLVR